MSVVAEKTNAEKTNLVGRKRPNVFESLDYRAFMAEMFEYLKLTQRAFSNRSFAKRAGFQSSGFFINVVKGRKALSTDGAGKVAVGLKLNNAEREHFIDIVVWTHEKDTQKRSLILKKIMSNRAFHERDPLKAAQLNYFSDLRMPVIRELILAGCKDRASILSKSRLPLSSHELEEILSTLISLDLINETPDGLLTHRRDAHTPAECPSSILKDYHRQMIEKGAEALESVERTLRDIQALTLAVNPEDLQALKSQLHRFLVDLSSRFEKTPSNDRVVYQINIQAFPLSK